MQGRCFNCDEKLYLQNLQGKVFGKEGVLVTRTCFFKACKGRCSCDKKLFLQKLPREGVFVKEIVSSKLAKEGVLVTRTCFLEAWKGRCFCLTRN
jgi:hypothetical protein